MKESVIEQQKKWLFDYWDEIDIIKELTPEDVEVIDSPTERVNLRAEIIDILSLGIKDTYPGRDEKILRHAMSAAEIKERLEERLEESVTASNVYFHLSKLEDAGLIEIVGSLPSGRRFTAYYGRVARVFLLEDDEMSFPIIPQLHGEGSSKTIEDIFSIIEYKSDLDPNEIDELKTKFLDLNQHRNTQDKLYSHAFLDWIEENNQIIRDLDINLIDFNMIFQELINYQQKVVETFMYVKELLGIEDYV